MKKILVSIVVPVLNGASSLVALLDSLLLSSFDQFEIIVNDDKRSADETEKLLREYSDRGLRVVYLRENVSMAQGRLSGSKKARGEYLLHVDSDMRLSRELLEECVKLSRSGFGALVIPEESYGTTFWARCKWLEKKCYDGVGHIESLRFLRKDVYDSLGGHDPKMVFSEDKDLDLRVRRSGIGVGRTSNVIYHDEGALSLGKTLRKKFFYTETANIFAERHPEAFRWQSNILFRYLIYLRNIRYLFSHPILYVGMVFMKTCEFSFGAFGYVISSWKRSYER